MRFLALMIFATVAVQPAIAFAQDAQCRCSTFPFEPDPPCFRTCTGFVVATVDIGTLRNVLHLSDDTLTKIKMVRSLQSSGTPSLASGLFTPEEESEIFEAVKNMTPGEAEYLLQSANDLEINSDSYDVK